MSTYSADSLTSEELDNVPQQPVQQREIPSYVNHLILASKAFKRYGWPEPAREFRRAASRFGEFESKAEFASAKAEVDLPDLSEQETDLTAESPYLELAWKEVEAALAEMEASDDPEDYRVRHRSVESHWNKYRQKQRRSRPGFAGENRDVLVLDEGGDLEVAEQISGE